LTPVCCGGTGRISRPEKLALPACEPRFPSADDPGRTPAYATGISRVPWLRDRTGGLHERRVNAAGRCHSRGPSGLICCRPRWNPALSTMAGPSRCSTRFRLTSGRCRRNAIHSVGTYTRAGEPGASKGGPLWARLGQSVASSPNGLGGSSRAVLGAG
jgi:hypothetical protein